MAGYRGHITGAFLFFLVYLGVLVYMYSLNAAYQQFSTLELLGYPVAMGALAIMFGLWPDVDTNSKGQDVFYAIFLVADLFLIATRNFEEAAYLGLFALLPVVSRHRGWTHSWWAMLLIPSPLLVLPYVLFPARPWSGLPFYGAALVGYFSHLLLDGIVWRALRRTR
mgnify:CR=1 FL=1|jgi:membrane-bound metal-dependent hydrolase YbcI (DUF457 family)